MAERHVSRAIAVSAAGTSFSLGAGDVHVWWIDLTHVTEGDAVLSPDERARAARLRQPRDRQQWIVARVAMRQILAGYAGVAPHDVRLATAAHGKPELVDEPLLRFSLTHAVDRAALAVARQREVGIDLEALDPALPGRRDLPALMTTACTISEAARIAAFPEEERLEAFLKIWTLKEAYLKGIGAGLMVEPRTLEITLGEDGAATIQALPLKGEGSWGSRRGPASSLIPLPPSPVEPGEGDVDVKTRRRMGQHVANTLPSPGSTAGYPPGALWARSRLGVRENAWTLRVLDPGPGWVAALAVAGSEPEITARHWPIVPR